MPNFLQFWQVIFPDEMLTLHVDFRFVLITILYQGFTDINKNIKSDHSSSLLT